MKGYSKNIDESVIEQNVEVSNVKLNNLKTNEHDKIWCANRKIG